MGLLTIGAGFSTYDSSYPRGLFGLSRLAFCLTAKAFGVVTSSNPSYPNGRMVGKVCSNVHSEQGDRGILTEFGAASGNGPCGEAAVARSIPFVGPSRYWILLPVSSRGRGADIH